VLVALQPVQFVSIAAALGAIEKAAFEEFAVTSPLPQPAANSSAGVRSSEKFLINSRMIKVLTYILSTMTKDKEKRSACGAKRITKVSRPGSGNDPGIHPRPRQTASVPHP
jgi:hypothetical protein